MPGGRTFAARGLALLLLLTAGCTLIGRDEELPLGEEDGEAGTVPAVEYDVDFEAVEGELPGAVERLLTAASESLQLADRPPASELIIRRRAEADLPRLIQALRSLGYYDGTVQYEIRHAGPPPAEGPAALLRGVGRLAGAPAPTQLVFRVRPGPLYRLSSIDVRVEGEAPGYQPPNLERLRLAAGDPAAADEIIDAEQRLLRLALEDGRPLARLGERRAVVDHPTESMAVTLVIEPGPVAPFGEIGFVGDEGVREAFLLRRMPFRPGDPFHPDLLEEARSELTRTNLFTTVLLRTPEALDGQGRLPVTFDLRVRAQRSIGLGVGYQSDEGPNARAYWEHRNLFRGGERFRAELQGSPVRQQLVSSFTKPDFLIRHLSLLAEADARLEETDAYDSRSVRVGIGGQYPLTEDVLGSLGVAYRYADIEESDGRDTFGLVSLPAQLDWDFSNDLLDPSHGGRVRLAAAPFFDTLGLGTQFNRAQITHTRYFSLLADRRLVLALRGSAASMFGASREEIPADERLYAGGGGSVRGVGFQLAGPLDDNNDPLGGRSLVELGTEFRGRFTETIGGVVFLDAGTVYESTVPDFSRALRLGTGVGLRYITAIGPIRFDVGFPLDRRSGVDDAYQFYISIGQAY